MNIKAADGHVWVWSKKAEAEAQIFFVEPHPAGQPAWLGDKLLGQDAPKVWVFEGYVEQQKPEDCQPC